MVQENETPQVETPVADTGAAPLISPMRASRSPHTSSPA